MATVELACSVTMLIITNSYYYVIITQMQFSNMC